MLLDFKDSEKMMQVFFTPWSLHSNDVIPLSKIRQEIPFAIGIRGNFLTLPTRRYELSNPL